MPPEVEQCVTSLMKKKSFYPNRSTDQRRSIAYGVCWERYKKKHKNDSANFFDAFLHMGIVKNSIIDSKEFINAVNIEDERFKPYEKFGEIHPQRPGSLIFMAQLQSELLFGEDPNIEIDQSAVEEALDIFNDGRWNTLFSSHRYSDEYAVGLIHSVDSSSRTAICEVLVGEGNPQGNIVADGIRTGRIRGVSTGMKILEQKCSICGAIGTPWLTCGHYPGEEYDGKIAKRTITKIRYFELSTTPLPADPYALVIRYNELFERIKSDGNIVGSETIINEDHQSINQLTKNEKEIDSMSKEIDETKELENKQNELSTKLNELLKQNEQLKHINNDLTTRVNTLESNNETLANYIQKQNAAQKAKLVEQVIQLKLNSKTLDPNDIENTRIHFNSLTTEQLDYEIKSARKMAELLAGNVPVNSNPNQPQNKAVPQSSDVQLSLENIEQVLINSRMLKFIKKLNTKGDRIEKRVEQLPEELKFQEITPQDRLIADGHITIVNGGKK